MQGILNKSSNGVSSSQQQQPPQRQPKTPSRRLIPHFRLPSGIRGLTRWRTKQPLNAGKDEKNGRAGGGVRFADEEEPKTEDSFDYKDIDFAAEIFDFRVPVQATDVPPRTRKPPRPPIPPPSPNNIPKLETPNAKSVVFADALQIHDGESKGKEDNHNDENTTGEIDYIDENVEESRATIIEEGEMDLGGDLTAEQKLTKFLRDHEGQELSETDVLELEKLLNETDEAEKELDKENVNTCTAQNQTQFEEEVVDEANLHGQMPKVVEELSIQLETEPTGHTDFSVIEFNKIEMDRSNQNSPTKKDKIIDDGIYEPVGEPILNCQNRLPHKLPDLSGFIVPKASNNIGDPFAWRRRGMRRWDRYGYEKTKNASFVPSNVQIIDGCQKVENYIISRDLSPPGYLLGVLGTNRKLRRKKKKKKAKAIPTVSVVPIHQHLVMEVCESHPDPSSFEDEVTSVILQETFDELKKNLSLNSEMEMSNEKEIVEREYLIVKSASPDNMEVESKPFTNESPEMIIENGHNEINDSSNHKNEEAPAIAIKSASETVDTDFQKKGGLEGVHTSRKDAFLKRNRPPRPLPPTPQSIQEFKPIRPSRRPKRVASAEPPPTKVKDEDLPSPPNMYQFECQTFPRRKETSRRSVSSEEVQRRIQLQAQQFFRTPRKKELQMMSSDRDKSQFSNFSVTSYQDSLRRRPRQSRLAPVYTPINKTCQRRKDFASQTSEIFEDEDDRESIPPPPPPKMHQLNKSSECILSDQLMVEDLSLKVERCHSKIYENESILPEVTSTVIKSPCVNEVPSLDRQPMDSFKAEEQQQSYSSIPSQHPYREAVSNIGNLPLMKLHNSDMQLALFCGFLPAGQSMPFNLKDLPEMTVHRLNVDHLEAGFIKVGQVEAAKLIVDQINDSAPLQYSKSSIADTATVNENTGKDLSLSEQQQPSMDSIESEKTNESSEREPSVIDLNGNDSLMSEKGLNWDENSSWSGRIIPSSSSASYVTCDETLHESITDSEFGTDVEDLDMEEVSTGASTPTPHDMDMEAENDYDLLRQVFAAAVANSSQNNTACAIEAKPEEKEIELREKEKCLNTDEEWEDENDNTVRVSRSRSSNSAIVGRNEYRRRAIKRNTPSSSKSENELRPPSPTLKPHQVQKSRSTNSPPLTTPVRTKPKSCPSGDIEFNGVKDLLETSLLNEQPVSSEDESNTESGSEEDEEKTVKNNSPIKPSKKFFIARELMTTEKTFVDVLKLLNKDLRAYIEKANRQFEQAIVPDDIYNRIFGCFPQLHALNEVLLQEMEERIEQWDTTPKISDIIVKHGPFLKIYISYIKCYSDLIANLDEACKRYPLFGDAIKSFEETDRCRKLEVRHYMLKPVQRIPQYRLLLCDYLKHLDKSSIDYAETEEALSIVSEVAEHANETMKETEKFAKLLQIQNNLFGGHQVVKPGRSFLREGDLFKLCRKGMRLRRFILFSDCLLHCSLTSQGQFKVHHELPLSDMTVQNSKSTESQNEFSIVSVARSFSLAANSFEEKEDWMKSINDAIAAIEAKRNTFLKAKLHNQNVAKVTFRTDEKLGQKAPVWIPDSRVTMCQICMREFTLTFRRHHCRACGKVVCSLCSANRAPLLYLNYQSVRVCYDCFNTLQKEIDKHESFMENHEADSNEFEHDNGIEPPSPSLNNIRAQFKQLAPIAGEPKKIHVPKVLQEVSANDTKSTISGYLHKKLKRGWKKQWFIVKEKVLYSYKASEDVAALDSTPLLGFSVRTFEWSVDGIASSHLFELHHSDQLSLLFHADNENVAKRWIDILKKAVVLE